MNNAINSHHTVSAQPKSIKQAQKGHNGKRPKNLTKEVKAARIPQNAWKQKHLTACKLPTKSEPTDEQPQH